MSSNVVIEKELISLKRRLDSAISARTSIETDFKNQSSLFTEFIIKLSLSAKGIDKSLDNKLAKLRTLLSSKIEINQVSQLINDISKILQQYSSKEDQTIRSLQSDFESAGKSLQKVSNLPDNLRRKLRTLLKENETSKEALSLYVPPLSQLVAFYQQVIDKKPAENIQGGLLKNLNKPTANNTDIADTKVIKKFTYFLDKISISGKFQAQLTKIKSELSDNMPNEQLLKSLLEAFDVISHDLALEIQTAKAFLSTLSATLSTVQSAVQHTISTQSNCQKKHTELNSQLQGQITDMAHGLGEANSLVDIKVDINLKLKTIAATLSEKTTLESSQQAELEKQLSDMQNKVQQLEKQAKVFEKRIQEQQARSLQDALTKLNNRAAFDEHFAKEIVRCQHNRTPLAIVIADLDDFKRINDTYGHTAGDKTLQVIASTFKKHIENKGFIARYGGEEFVFVFSGKDKNSLMPLLESLIKNVAKLPLKFKNNKVSMTLSVGVTHIKQDDNVHIAFERADTALYQAKENGKNAVVYIE